MLYPNIIVRSGSSFISGQQYKTLKANLGSCIGIAMFDKTNKVGGILHTLLPEPYSNFVDIEEKYASTGLPKFIDELIKAGADINCLEACVAGGAFPGEPNNFDYYINLGGKTAEKVSKILNFYKITILQWETGGFFSSYLTLNLSNFEASITPVIEDGITMVQDCNFKKPEKTEIEEKADSIKPIPQIVLKIISMINSSSASLKEIGKEIKKDQVISAKALQLSNSAAFDRIYPIDTIDEAILRIGEENILKYILNHYIKEMFSSSERGYSLCKGGLFHHSLSTALINEKLCAFTGVESPQTGYTAGLLHDLGKILLDQYVSDSRPLFYRELVKQTKNITDVEQELFGMDHSEAGLIIAKKWKLPQVIHDVIKFHHNPEKAEKNKIIIILTHISDILSSWYMTGVLPESSKIDITLDILEKVSLTPQKILEFTHKLPLKEFSALFPLQLNEVSGKKECVKVDGGVLCH
ncbi:MAG: HDOD domain-containing protein [Desulfobacteraceae bacterium]|nr:HDOD domain-containing protein [Desulfobacteraceae bacterium]